MQVLTQQATQREAAEKWGVDRSTVVADTIRISGRGVRVEVDRSCVKD